MYLQLIWAGVNWHNLLKNQIALTFYNISYDQIKYSDLHWVAVCTITSRSHGNGKTDIGLSNLDMPTKHVSFSHSPTTAIMKNVYLRRSIIMQKREKRNTYAVSKHMQWHAKMNGFDNLIQRRYKKKRPKAFGF